jgi:hypothetical protein
MTNLELGDRLARLEASVAGLIGIVAELTKIAAENRRTEVLTRMTSELEVLHAMLLAEPSTYSDAALRGLEDVRDSVIRPAEDGSAVT